MIEARKGSGVAVRQPRDMNDHQFDPNEQSDARILAHAIGALAEAINRLAATQERPQSKGAVSFSQATYADKPDAQTAALRELAGTDEE